MITFLKVAWYIARNYEWDINNWKKYPDLIKELEQQKIFNEKQVQEYRYLFEASNSAEVHSREKIDKLTAQIIHLKELIQAKDLIIDKLNAEKIKLGEGI